MGLKAVGVRGDGLLGTLVVTYRDREMKTSELREMSDEQLGLTLKDSMESLFRLRIRSQTERLDTPSETRKHRRLIARIKTIQRQRELVQK